MSRVQDMQKYIRWYRDETGKTEIDMHDVALFAVRKGYPLPKPKEPMARLAAQLSIAARQDYREDAKNGARYRVNHAYSFTQGGKQQTLWVDIDVANRKQMAISMKQRREQVVGDVYQLTMDLEHWNAIHPAEEPIIVPLDMEPDVEWRRNEPNEGERAG